MKKNIIFILFILSICFMICACKRTDVEDNTLTDSTSADSTLADIIEGTQSNQFISTEVVWQDNSKDLYSATQMPVSLYFEKPKEALEGGASMATLGATNAAALKKHLFENIGLCWDEIVYVSSDGEKKSISIAQGIRNQAWAIGSVWGNEHYVVYITEADQNIPDGIRYVLCELDGNMQEIERTVLNYHSTGYVYPLSLLKDKDNNVHMILSAGGENIYCILSKTGEICQKIDLDKNTETSLIFTGNGEVALRKDKEIIKLDPQNGRETRLDNMENHGGCVTYWDEENILFADTKGVYLENILDGNKTALYLWQNHGIRIAEAVAVSRFDDEAISVLIRDSKGYVLVNLKPTEGEVEVKNINFAVSSWNKNAYSTAIMDFNRKYPAYHINLVEYGQDNQKLLTEMIAGKGPVILDTGLVNLDEITDYLEPLDEVFCQMELDEEILPQVIEMGKVNGKLYGIVSNFYINTVITAMDNPRGWNYEEFIKCIDKNDSLTSIFNGNSLDDGIAFIFKYFIHGLSDNYLLDVDNTATKFDTEEFRKIIRWGKQYQGTRGDYENLMDGTMLCLDVAIRKPEDISGIRVLMGEDANYIGFPCNDGKGHYMSAKSMLAITNNATDEEKRIAHSFIKMMLSYEQQLEASESYEFNLSVRKDVLEEQIKNISVKDSVSIMYLPNFELKEEQLDYEKDRKILYDLLENSKPDSYLPDELSDILWEELMPYFDGEADEDKVITNLKGRVDLYIGEK